MATDYRNQFTEGFHADDLGSACPYLLTSDYSDAWMLGRFASRNGLGSPAKKSDLVKSRGSVWKLKGFAYRVEGTHIERIA